MLYFCTEINTNTTELVLHSGILCYTVQYTAVYCSVYYSTYTAVYYGILQYIGTMGVFRGGRPPLAQDQNYFRLNTLL